MKKILFGLALCAAFSAHADDLAKKREQHKADIDFWTTKYDASELKSGKFRCPSPRFPSLSKQNEEIDAIAARMKVWQDCYNAFAANLNAMTPPTKRIPKDVLELMTPEEVATATAHITEAQTFVADSATVNSKLVLADYDAWRKATEDYVHENNKVIKAAQANDRPDLDDRRNNYGGGSASQR
jgi:hypothetical protein